MIANFTVACVTLVVGWVALWPLRRSLGSTFYHLAALPVGTIGWSVVAAATTVAGVRPQPVWIALGLAVYVALVVAVSSPFASASGPPPASLRSFAFVGAGFAALSALLAWAGWTLVGVDGYSHYELSGWFLADTGQLSPIIMSARNTLVPALHMANRVFGAEWLYVPYPLFSVNTLAITAWLLWRHAFAPVPGRRRLVLTAAAVGALALVPMWFFHTWLVHSNMVSALFTTLAVASTLVAAGILRDRSGITRPDGAVPPAPDALGVIAGLALAGLALARPDGLAYVFHALVLVAVCHLEGRLPRRTVVATYASLMTVLLAIYGAAFLRIGLWPAGKLQGSWAAALLGAIVVFGALTVLAGRIDPVARWLRRAGVMRLAIAVDALAIVAVAVVYRGQFLFALRNMVANLALAGAWGLTWWALLVAVAVSVIVRVRDSDEHWRRLLMFAVFQFFAIALVIHASVHPGHIALSDSFNRVALHIVPIAFWYVASYFGALSASRGILPQGS